MDIIQNIIGGALVLWAIYFLYKTFFPSKKKNNDKGCDENCKCS